MKPVTDKTQRGPITNKTQREPITDKTQHQECQKSYQQVTDKTHFDGIVTETSNY
ncbi:hypothetical protein HanXRQr2_Chr05g0203001 [Helianthus annuus]|uniref:Uncharacterized protein n=1 Tax=Helianthus annuus TaxID=4232 RepID=A0A9K3IXL5_HELAN|nr:hypothetical protein HanXRQr2_Chr05g0203001 [Helianthus annuus]